MLLIKSYLTGRHLKNKLMSKVFFEIQRQVIVIIQHVIQVYSLILIVFNHFISVNKFFR